MQGAPLWGLGVPWEGGVRVGAAGEGGRPGRCAVPGRSLVIGLVVMVAVAGCGTDDVTETTSTVASQGAPEPIEMPGPGDPRDVLFIGFDDVFTRAVGTQYGEALTGELGVDVNVVEPTGFDHVFTALLLDQLRGNRYPPLDDAVPPAEIIVLLSRPGESANGADDPIEDDFEACWWRAATGEPPTTDTSGDYWSVYRALLGEVLDELWDLRRETATAILVLDMYNPSVAAQRESGIEDACVAWFESWREVITEVATEHGAAVVSLMDAFNGPDHRTDPTELDLIGPTEEDPSAPWYRLTPAGVDLMVETLVEAGVMPTTPSR